MALIVQKTGQRQGIANARFYQLGNAQYGAAGAVVFHDSTSGNNSVPGVTGYPCTTGYDLSTGLGSVDANSLVTNWTPDFTMTASPGAVSVQQGASGTTMVSTSIVGNFNSTVLMSASGLPSGATAAFAPNPIAAPGSGSSLLAINADASTAAGVYPVTISGVGSGMTHTVSVNLTILQVFTITSSVTNGTGGTITPSTASVLAGGNACLTISASTGYHLFSLIDNGVDVTASVNNGNYSIMNVTTNHTVVATFAINAYSVNASVGSGSGNITPANSIVNYGSPFTVTITADSGYTLGGLTDNGIAVTATSTGSGNYTYTIASVTQNHTIQASFTPDAVSSVPALGIWGMLATVAVLGAFVGRSRRILIARDGILHDDCD
jgi:hypothetical protein